MIFHNEVVLKKLILKIKDQKTNKLNYMLYYIKK